jgi:hypothetical protein
LPLVLALVTLCGGACSRSTWYYHWRCNGDPDCLELNPTGQPSGTADEGNEVSCRQLLTFSSKFWGPAAEDACDQSESWNGTTGGNRDAGTGADMATA